MTSKNSPITDAQSETKSYEQALKAVNEELTELEAHMQLAVAKLTAINTIYNETGMYNAWFPLYTVMVREIEGLEKEIDLVALRKKKFVNVIRDISVKLAIETERLVDVQET